MSDVYDENGSEGTRLAAPLVQLERVDERSTAMFPQTSSTAFSIGVDLGGTNLRVGAYDSQLQCLELTTLATRLQDGPPAVFADMCNAILSLEERFSAFGRFVGVGVGTPGPLELPAGVIREAPNLPGWDRVDIRSEIEDRIGHAIVVECDANTAALAEFAHYARNGDDIASLCMLTLGTGVGNGLIVDGRIWHGDHGMAGEAGHMTIYPDGLLCGCGNTGCLEQYASATAVRRMMLERCAANSNAKMRDVLKGYPNLTAKDVADLARTGNPTAVSVYVTVGQALGLALASLINTLNMRLYLIGGGLIGSWDLFAPVMMREIEQRSYVYRITKADLASRSIRIEPARLGATSGIVGAAALPFQTVLATLA
jgi:glucokinase